MHTTLSHLVAAALALILLVGACEEFPDVLEPEPLPTTLELAVDTADTLAVGADVTVTVRILDQDGSSMDDLSVALAVDSGGGTVSPSSVVTGPDGAETTWTLGTTPGPQWLRATYDSLEAGAGLEAVPGPAQTLTLSADSLSFHAFGDTAALGVTAEDAYGNAIAFSDIDVSSTDSTIVALDPAGVATAVGNGAAAIIAAHGDAADTAAVTVHQVIAGVLLDPPVDTVSLNRPAPQDLVVEDSNGYAVERDVGIAWSSSDPTVLTVDTTGVVTGVSLGLATVSVAVADDTLQADRKVAPDPQLGLAVGERWGCVLDVDGAAYCWGENADGVIGDGTTTTDFYADPVAVTGGHVFVQLTAGRHHACGLTESGEAWCWGSNAYGQLGIGVTDTLAHAAPEQVVGGHTFDQVSATWWHTCAVTTAGEAYCWGRNDKGQLGDGTTTDSGSPTLVSGGLTFAAITAGLRHTCARTDGDAVYCWGENDDGEFGDGGTTGSPTPVQAAGGALLAQVSAGAHYTCGVNAADGLGYCWGEGISYRLGHGSTDTSDQLDPVRIDSDQPFRLIHASWEATCGLTWDGTAYCWGSGHRGATGDGTAGTVHSPAAVATASAFGGLTVGFDNACGVTADGRLLCWGYATAAGQFAHATTPTATTASGVDVTAGIEHSCAVASDGSGSCWGLNSYGLGDGATSRSSTPVTIDLTDMASISAGWRHTCALQTTGALYCWGSDQLGESGQGGLNRVETPAAVMPDSSFSALATGLAYTCAVGTGTLRCWGRNNYYQVAPVVDDPILSPTIRLDSGVEAVTAGLRHACALMADSTGVCWGSNEYSELGSPSSDPCGFNNDWNCSADTLVVDGLAFDTIVAGRRDLSCGITGAGDAYCWGLNQFGQLGDGTTTNRTSPVLVSGGHSWSRIEVGEYTTCGIDTDGQAWCWGRNRDYQLGTGSTDPYSTTPVALGLALSDIAISDRHACGTTPAETVLCWGYHHLGQTGLGLLSYRLTPVMMAGSGWPPVGDPGY